MRNLSPFHIRDVVDYEGNICHNLANFMEFIKVFPFRGHEDGNTPSIFWRQWKLRGFMLKSRIYEKRDYAYLYDGFKIENSDEYFKKKYIERIKDSPEFAALKELSKKENLLLIDVDYLVPNTLREMLLS